MSMVDSTDFVPLTFQCDWKKAEAQFTKAAKIQLISFILRH